MKKCFDGGTQEEGLDQGICNLGASARYQRIMVLLSQREPALATVWGSLSLGRSCGLEIQSHQGLTWSLEPYFWSETAFGGAVVSPSWQTRVSQFQDWALAVLHTSLS